MRRVLDKFFPIGTKRRTFLFEQKKCVKKIIVKFSERLYKIVPLGCFKNITNRMNNQAFYIEKSKEKLHPKKNEYIIFDKYQQCYALSHPLNDINKKIAVHIHLYYQDLLEEFIKYLNNIPYDFDIYCSINENSNEDQTLNELKKIKNVKRVVVKETPNIGRDYAPMVCEFRKSLKKYDYICHIHTKKSLRTGTSQDHWRIHLLDGVLGSTNLIKNIFYMLEKMNVGIYFPDSDVSAPYWGNTWMGARQLGVKYLSLLGIPFEDNYQDFSVGSMFWVKTNAVKQIFEKMLDRMEEILNEYKDEIENENLSVHEILTLASVIELESMHQEDRKDVASVLYNRLSKNMSLGSDVTTYYSVGINMGDRDLYKVEINAENPYNTRGPNMEGKLPVGPIASVSKSSIEAAINPNNTNYLFFVADKNGKVYFTNTNEEHEQMIQDLVDKGLWYEYED